MYEEEADLFFEGLANRVIADDVLSRLLTFPNVLVTGHQANFTHDPLTRIVETTIANISNFESGSTIGERDRSRRGPGPTRTHFPSGSVHRGWLEGGDPGEIDFGSR